MGGWVVVGGGGGHTNDSLHFAQTHLTSSVGASVFAACHELRPEAPRQDTATRTYELVCLVYAGQAQ
jgi:hypothetical protein